MTICGGGRASRRATSRNPDRNSKALLDAIAQAKVSGAKAAVIATENPLGLLQTPNRDPKIASGPPTVLVPGTRRGHYGTAP